MSALDAVAIVGGGIGGMAAAIALRLREVPVSVYERSRSPTGQGAGIVCWPNACFVLDQLGLLEKLRSVGGAPTAMRRIRDDGRELGAIASLVVGADGRMGSVVRTFVAGDNQPRYQGFVNWVGIYDAPSPLFADMSIRDYWGVGLRFGIVPITPTRAYWAAGAAQPSIIRSEPESRRRGMARLFEGWPAPIGAILASPSAENVHEIHVHDHDPLDRWHRDNVVLLGDAAHAALPTSGQGACQALEDAWHLVEVLETDRAASLDAALHRFTQRRLDKTRDINRAGRALARSLFDTDPAACRRRDEQASTLDYDEFAQTLASLWIRGLPPATGRASFDGAETSD